MLQENQFRSRSTPCTELDDLAAGRERIFGIKEVLYIEKTTGPNDIAFVRVDRRIDGARQGFIAISEANLAMNDSVVTIGYPAKAPKRIIPDQNLMKELYRDRYDVKRAAPGMIMVAERDNSAEHDCTTLGGNSGSVIIDPKTGKAAGLHFAGLYKQANYAVPASVLNSYIKGERWREPPVVETRTVVQTVVPKPPAAIPTPRRPLREVSHHSFDHQDILGPAGGEVERMPAPERDLRNGSDGCEQRLQHPDRGNPLGTGFLVGPDTVLTNYHVVEKLIDRRRSVRQAGNLRVRLSETAGRRGTGRHALRGNAMSGVERIRPG